MRFLLFVVFAVIMWVLFSYSYVIIPLKLILSVLFAVFFAIWVFERISHS